MSASSLDKTSSTTAVRADYLFPLRNHHDKPRLAGLICAGVVLTAPYFFAIRPLDVCVVKIDDFSPRLPSRGKVEIGSKTRSWWAASESIDPHRKQCKRRRSKLREAVFSYVPLSPRQVRILHLLPGSGSDDVHISFATYPIDNIPEPYEGLSYTWGHCCFSHAVQCDGGKTILVSCALHEALRNLRHATQARRLWVDALCINQEDLQERASQVHMMADIYRNSRGVVVWLGKAGRNVDTAFNIIERLSTVDRCNDQCEGRSPGDGAESWKRILEKHGLPSPNSRAWEALRELFWRSWFFRVWVIQEVALAREGSVTVCCGSNTTTWAKLRQVAVFISERNGAIVAIAPPGADLNVNAYPFLRLDDIITKVRQSDKDLSLLQVLLLARNSVASLPVDRLYGVLGLASDPGTGIRPRYDLKPSDLFRTCAMVHLRSSLDILTLNTIPHWSRMKNLASWIPDWSQPSFSTPLLSLSSAKGWCATGDSVASVDFGPDGEDQCITLTGIPFDTITSRSLFVSNSHRSARSSRSSRTIPFSRFEHVGRASFLRFIWTSETLVAPMKGYPTGDDLVVAFCQTLCAGVDVADGTDESLRDIYYGFQDHFFTSKVPKATPGVLRFIDAFTEACIGRSIFITSKGYMGLGRASVSVGDSVVLLNGGKTPYVLHRLKDGKKKAHWFEGEAYVHGIMHGEAFEANKPTIQFTVR